MHSSLTRIEKILIGITFVFGVGDQLLRWVGIHPIFVMGLSFFSIISDIALTILIIHYISKLKFSLFSVVLLLLIVSVADLLIVSYFQMDLASLRLSGVVASIIFALLILWTMRKREGETDSFVYFVAVALIVQGLLVINPDPKWYGYQKPIMYLLVGIIGTLKMKDLELPMGVDKILNIYLVQGLIMIFNETVYTLR